MQLNWNSGSTGLLVVVQSDVDKTNQSYYGESKLNYLTTDGTHEGVVPLSMYPSPPPTKLFASLFHIVRFVFIHLMLGVIGR